MRLTVLRNSLFFCFGFIILALVYMQVIRGEYFHELSIHNRIRVVPAGTPRGRILDRNGAVLADNRRTFNVAVIPQDVDDARSLFQFLGDILKKPPEKLLDIFNLNRHRLRPFDPVPLAQAVDRHTVIAIEENKFQYPGVVIEESFQRFYPNHEIGSHVLGYVGPIAPVEAQLWREYGYSVFSLVGRTGVEQYYEPLLQGLPGGNQIEVNNRGQEVRLLGTKESAQGKDIVLTIDQRVQMEAAQLLGNDRGSVVVMDMDSGDVLALASSPSYDPNAFTNRKEQGKIEAYMANAQKPLFNRAISGQFPPGSVFKIPVALAGLERQKIDPETTFDCPGFLMLGQSRFGCAHVHGAENLRGAIAHSCNVYFYHTGQLVTAPIIGAFARALGLNRPTGIDLPSEAKGNLVVPSPTRRWYTGNTLNLAIGQGDTLNTPLQLTVMMAAVANDGILLQPRVLRAVDGTEMVRQDLSKRPRVRLREKTWSVVRDGLRQAVREPQGTAYLLHDLAGMDIWGKTGTAQAAKGENHHAWFVGYARSSKKNLAFCIFLEHGGTSINAVALTRNLLQRIQLLGII